MLKKVARHIDPELHIPSKILPGVLLNPSAFTATGGNPGNADAVAYHVTKVFYQSPNYSIFEVNNSKAIEYITVDDVRYNTQAITPKLNRIDFWLRDSQLRQSENNFLETAADAIAQCFEGKTSEALQTVGDLETLIKNEVYRYSKMIYLLPYLFLVMCMVGYSLWVNYWCGCTGPHCDQCWCKTYESLIHMATFGAIGGMLSVSRHMDTYSVEVKYKRGWLIRSILDKYLIAVMVRFSTSIFGAITLYVLLTSKFINIDTITTEKGVYVLYSLAILAGFSENLVPNMMTKFETSLVTKDAVRVTPEPTVAPSTQTTAGTTPPTPPASAGATNSTSTRPNSGTADEGSVG